LVGACHELGPNSVRKVCETLDLKRSELPGLRKERRCFGSTLLGGLIASIGIGVRRRLLDFRVEVSFWRDDLSIRRGLNRRNWCGGLSVVLDEDELNTLIYGRGPIHRAQAHA
jgi:hypothetical protein